MYEFLVVVVGGGGGQRFFWLMRAEGGAASTEIASWGAAGCPAIGDGRPDKWACGARRPKGEGRRACNWAYGGVVAGRARAVN
jgi:hypothetical protein